MTKHLVLNIFILAIFIISILFIFEGHTGLSLGDEGFLWYGAQRVMLGEVPIRDFMSYDPGRYYYSAALMSFWGNNGIMALRGAVAIFQTLGLFIGLLLIAQTKKKQNVLYLLVSAITLTAWMFPRHKLFDISLSIFLIGILTFLIINATSRRYFITGVSVGLIAVFGRNHGVYGVVGSLAILLWLNINRTHGPKLITGFAFWVGGVVIGYLPIILMGLLVPDFADAFIDGIKNLIETGDTNLPLPIPWPWRVNFTILSLDSAIRAVWVGLFFIGIIIFSVLSIFWVVLQKFHHKPVSPTLVATSFLSLPYAHLAFSRADISHLAQGSFPLLIGCLILLSTQKVKIKWPLVLLLCTTSLEIMSASHPGWQCYLSKQCVTIEISGSHLLVNPNIANDVVLLRQLADQYTPEGQSFIAAPFLPGAYALLERKSPVRDIYPIKPRSLAFQKAEIEKMQASNVRFAIIIDLALDGREELRYRNTNSIIYQHIMDHFEKLPSTTNPNMLIYKAKVKTS